MSDAATGYGPSSGRSRAEWAVRLALVFVGAALTQIGVALFILSRQGSDPFTIFVQGLSSISGLSIGTWHVIIQASLLILFLGIARSYIRPGTFICVFCSGPMIDGFSWLLRDIIPPDLAVWPRIVIMLVGTCIMSSGVSLIIRTDAGTGPNDLVSVIIADRLKRVQFRWVRVSVDTVLTIAGFLLGGVFGLGTFAGAFLTGPIVQLFFPLWTRVVSLCVGEATKKT